MRQQDGTFHLGPAWAQGTMCCGKPIGCTNMTPECRMRNHPWKRQFATPEVKAENEADDA